jgi:hypothetical protein
MHSIFARIGKAAIGNIVQPLHSDVEVSLTCTT